MTAICTLSAGDVLDIGDGSFNPTFSGADHFGKGDALRVKWQRRRSTEPHWRRLELAPCNQCTGRYAAFAHQRPGGKRLCTGAGRRHGHAGLGAQCVPSVRDHVRMVRPARCLNCSAPRHAHGGRATSGSPNIDVLMVAVSATEPPNDCGETLKTVVVPTTSAVWRPPRGPGDPGAQPRRSGHVDPT